MKKISAILVALILIFTFSACKAEKPAPKPIPLEKVRAVLAEKSVQGKRKEVQALIIKYGAERLSDIAPEHYASLLAEAEGL